MRLSKPERKDANGIAIVVFAIFIAATAISPFFSGIAFASSQQTASTCTYGSINTNNWISINMLVVLAIMTMSGIIYALGGVMQARTREKFTGMAKYEFAEGIISLLIIAILLAFSSSICSFTQSMSQSLLGTQISDPFQFGQYYVGTLLFDKGTSILTQLYSISVTFYVWSLIVSSFETQLLGRIIPTKSLLSTPYLNVTLQFSPNIESFFATYSALFDDFYAGLILLSFGGLFLLFLTIPIVKAISLTVLVPVAIAMRSIGFAGPRLREASNSFLALGIALYFIFPMTLVFNAYTVSWIYCTSINGVSISQCMPSSMSIYVGTYNLNTSSSGSLFSSNSVSLSSSSLPASITIPGSVFGLLWSSLPIYEIMYAPNAVQTLGNIVAQYLFEGIVLVALDIAMTIGFALGLTKGLNSIAGILGGGSVWRHE